MAYRDPTPSPCLQISRAYLISTQRAIYLLSVKPGSKVSTEEPEPHKSISKDVESSREQQDQLKVNLTEERAHFPVI